MKLVEEQTATQCAWCLQEQGRDMGEGSHGVCEPHQEQIMIDYHTRKYEHVPSYVEEQAKRFAREY